MEELARLRKEVSAKADKSLVEIVRRNQVKLFQQRYSQVEARALSEDEIRFERLLVEDQVEEAFIALMDYVERRNREKVDAAAIAEKASKDYITQCFREVGRINNEHVRSIFASFEDMFSRFAAEIERDMGQHGEELERGIAALDARCTKVLDAIHPKKPQKRRVVGPVRAATEVLPTPTPVIPRPPTRARQRTAKRPTDITGVISVRKF